MAQINLHTTEEFERDLLTIMSSLKIFGKSKAIRLAVHEVANAFRAQEESRAPAPALPDSMTGESSR